MTDAVLYTLLAIAIAVALDFGIMGWLRSLLQRHGRMAGGAVPEVRVLGYVSPLLTLLRYGRLPQPGAPPPARPRPQAVREAAPAGGGGPRPAPRRQSSAALGTSLGRRVGQWAAGWFGDPPAPAASLSKQDADAALLGLGVGLLIMVSAQLALARNWENYLAIGLVGYAVGVGLFLWSANLIAAPPAPAVFVAARPARGRPRLAFWLTTGVLALYPALNMRRDLTPVQDTALDICWLLSLAVFSWSVLRLSDWRPPGLAALAQAWRAHRLEALAVAAVAVLALAARTYDLEVHPYSFVNDEGEVGAEALQILDGKLTNWFEGGWSGQPVLSFVPTAVSVAIFGNTAFAARFVGAVGGTLAVVFTYLLAREAFDRPTGFLAAIVLAGMPWHMHYSRLGVSNVLDTLFASGVLWLTYRALKRGRLPDYLWAGLAAGLPLFSYVGSRLVTALALGTLGYAFLRQRGYLRGHWKHLLIFGLALLLVVLPTMVYFTGNMKLFMGRINSENIIANGWIYRAAEENNRSTLDLMTWQFLNSVLVYVARDAPNHFFNSPQPLLPWLAAIFFVFGMAWTIRRIREARYMMVFAWYWAVVIFGSVLTLGPPAQQRMIMAAPVTALLVALGLRQIARLGQEFGLIAPRLGLALTGVVAVVTCVQGITFYFGEYRTGHYFEDPSNEVAYEASRYGAEVLGSDYRLYLLGHPSVFEGFGNFRYLAPELNTQDYNTVSADTLAALPDDRGAFFVAIPARLDDLRWVADQLPGGQWLEVPRRYQGPKPVYYAYVLTREQFAVRRLAGQ